MGCTSGFLKKKTAFRRAYAFKITFFFFFFHSVQTKIDHDKMSRSVANVLELYCLPISLLWDAKHTGSFTWSFYASIVKF